MAYGYIEIDEGPYQNLSKMITMKHEKYFLKNKIEFERNEQKEKMSIIFKTIYRRKRGVNE